MVLQALAAPPKGQSWAQEASCLQKDPESLPPELWLRQRFSAKGELGPPGKTSGERLGRFWLSHQGSGYYWQLVGRGQECS